MAAGASGVLALVRASCQDAAILATRRRELLACCAGWVALWSLFFVQARQSMPIHDDWYQLGWLQGRNLDLALIWRELHHNYFHANPRIGDVFLLMVNGSRAVHAILTPLAELALLWTAFVVAFGRRPRARYRDLLLALVLQVLIWLVSPLPGVMYFYRPYATNYVFAFATTLALFVPYRLALAGASPRARNWLAPGMLALGWLAGMSNEHTGPTALVAVVGAVVYAARHRRLRAWMIAGALGLAVGYAMLLFAPGQAERYSGIAARFSPLGLIASRGVAGNYDVLVGFISEAQWAIVLVIAALLGFVHSARRRDGGLPVLPRGALLAIAGLVAAAGAIVVTLFASPETNDRLLFAPAVLLAGALAGLLDYALAARRLRIAIAVSATVVFAYHAVRFVESGAAARRDIAQRMARLRAAAPGSVATVPPLRTPRSRWFRGDDFRLAEVREYVAQKLYGLRGIELEPAPLWAEPTPPGRHVASWDYEPALPPALAAVTPTSAEASHFLSTSLMLLRLRLGLGHEGVAEGRALARYRIDVVERAAAPGADPLGLVELGFADPAHRPIHLLDWSPTRVRALDAEGTEDSNHEPAIRVRSPARLVDWTEAYVVGCGETLRVTPERDPAQPSELLLPVTRTCRGTYTGVLCDATECWLGGRQWH